MSFTAKDVLGEAATTLVDADHVRWPLPELLAHLNDGIRAIVSLKPNANSRTLTLTLAEGTLQTLPENCTVLSRVTRNMVTGHDEAGGPVGGEAIRLVMGRALMDAFFPAWQSDAALFARRVRHVIYDAADLRRFYVIPGNDGTGKIEAVVGVMPAAIAVPASPASLASYTATVDLPDRFRTPLTDYVLGRAFGKDSMVPASEARAAKHMGLFTEAMASITAAEQGAAMTASRSGA